MGEWIWVAEALKIHHITKPTLYKYIGLWKVFTKVEKNRLFIDRLWLKEYINNKKKYWWKAVNTYIKWLFDDNSEKTEKEPEKQTIDNENNSQNRLATVTVWWLWKMIEDLQWLIQTKDLLIEKKNKTITRLTGFMWFIFWLFISLLIAFIYFVML